MEWGFDTFMWLLLTVIIPGSAFLLNVGLRFSKGIPLSSGSDLVLLLVTYAACVVADPAILKGLASPEIRERIVPIHFAFLIASGLSWFLSVTFVEQRLTSYYQSFSKVAYADTEAGFTEATSFPYFSWLFTWCLSFAIVVVYLFVLRL